MDTTTLFAKIDPFFAAAQLQTPMIDRLYASRAHRTALQDMIVPQQPLHTRVRCGLAKS